MGDCFEVPAFLRHNFFLGSFAKMDYKEKVLILSASGTFTPLHLDAYGMQGWMYLIAGEKHWGCHPPGQMIAL